MTITATRIKYQAPLITADERKTIGQYLDMLVESDRSLTSAAAQDLLIENFVLTPQQAAAEYRLWLHRSIA